jgi:putative hydrolases of HD superfamily
MYMTKLSQYLFEISSLSKVARSHRQRLLTSDLSDNIASHSYLVSVIAYFLAQLEGVDSGKVVLMALFHDTAETRTGDQNWIAKKYVKAFESEAVKDQLTGLPSESELFSNYVEYEKRETKESQVAKDADIIAQIILLKEYEQNGNLVAKKWLNNQLNEKSLSTKSGKALAKEISHSSPDDWSEGNWSEKRRE